MKIRSVIIFAGLIFAAGLVQAQEHEGVTLVEASLIADSETLVPGRGVTVAVRLDIAEDWHTYWENPGDSGAPMRIEWEAPEGVRIGPIHWPLPYKLVEPGNLKVYAYKEEVLLLARVFASPGLDLDEVTIRATADWLVCRELCLPGEAEFSLTLAVAEEREPVHEELFAKHRERLPRRFALDDNGIETRWERDGNTMYLLLKNVSEDVSVDFFPLLQTGVLPGHASKTDSWPGEGDFVPDRVLEIPLDTAPADLRELKGVLVVEEDGGGRRTGLIL